MNLLQTYLLVANGVALVLGLIGTPPLAQVVFSLIGAGPGVLVSSLVRDRHTRKDNVAPRFAAAWATIAWVLALVNFYGWNRFDLVRLQQNLSADHTPLLAYLAAVNIVTFVLFCVDKRRAMRQAWRIPEGVLLGFSLVGGAAGGLLGMLVAHHKVRKAYFRVGVPLALLLDLAVVAYLVQAGLA